jgi:hypothetical protein
MVPGKNGGTYLVYNRILRPFVCKHQDSVDKALDKAKEALNGNFALTIFNTLYIISFK